MNDGIDSLNQKNITFLKKNNINSIVINKVVEGSPHIVEYLSQSKIDLVINTTENKQAIRDSFTIRRTAVDLNVPYYTNLRSARILCKSIIKLKNTDLEVKPIQKHHIYSHKNLFESFASLVKNVTNITDRMSLYSIIIGLLMSFIIIQYQMNLQKNNILRLKMIGVNNKTIRNSFLIEFGLISFSASCLGIVFGSIGSYFISMILFESYWDFRPDILLLYFFFIPILTILIVSFFTSKMIHQKENVLFG